MTVQAQLYLVRAATCLTSMRVSVAIVQRHLNSARQLVPLPEGSIDLFDDIEAMQKNLERLQKQFDALATGQPLPAV